MTGRAPAVAVMVLGAALAVLPSFTWYAVPRPDGAVRVTGFGGAGQLLLLPVVGAAAVLAGAALLSARPAARRPTALRAGLLAATAGLMALGFTLWAALAPDVELRAGLPGGALVVPAPVDVASAAVVAPVLAGILALLGVLTAWAARPR